MVRRGAAARTGDDDAGESDGGEAEGGGEANARARVSQLRLRRGLRLRKEGVKRDGRGGVTCQSGIEGG